MSFILTTPLPAPGTSGNVLTSNGTIWTSAPGSTSGSYIAPTSEALIAADPVLMRQTGVLEKVASSSIGNVSFSGTFDYASSTYGGAGAIYDSVNNVSVFFFSGVTATVGYVVAVSASGVTLTAGSAVAINGASNSRFGAISYDTNAGKFVVIYADSTNSDYLTAQVGTVTGTSISLGTKTVINSQPASNANKITYDPVQQRHMVVFRQSPSQNIAGAIGTVSGTSFSITGIQSFHGASGTSQEVSALVYDSTQNRHLCIYALAGAYLARTLEVNSTSTFILNSSVTVEASGASLNLFPSAAYDITAQRILLCYFPAGTFSLRVGTVTATSSTYGTSVAISSASDGALVYDAAIAKVAFFNRSTSTNDGQITQVTITGTVPSIGSYVQLYSSLVANVSGGAVYDPVNGICICGVGTSSDWRSYSIKNRTLLTATNFAGFSSGAYSAGSSAKINANGTVQTGLSGLTPGQSYYLQPSGSLSTTPGSPSVYAGLAIDTTKLLIRF